MFAEQTVRPVRRTLPLIGWEQRELSCGWGRNINKNGWWCQYFTCFGGNWPVCWLVGGAALSLGPRMIHNSSWIKLWGMIKVYWLDFSLHFGSCCLLCFCRKFGPKLASHYKPVKKRSIVRRTVRTMLSELKVRLSSFKKRITVRRNVRSMFGEQTVRPIKNELKGQVQG